MKGRHWCGPRRGLRIEAKKSVRAQSKGKSPSLTREPTRLDPWITQTLLGRREDVARKRADLAY